MNNMKLLQIFLVLPFAVCTIAAKEYNHFKNPETLKKYMLFQKKLVHGWCSDEKSTKMLDLILSTKPRVCVEIGVYGGSSIFPTALGLKYNRHGKVYAIDPWSNDDCIQFHKDGDPNKKFWGTIDLEAVYASYTNMLNKFKLNKFVNTLRMTSEKALKLIPDHIDILHIDGNHQEEACYYDTTHFFSKVKIGGYIWFDDAGWYDSIQKKRTTKKSLDYLLNYCELLEVVDKTNCVLLRKLKGS